MRGLHPMRGLAVQKKRRKGKEMCACACIACDSRRDLLDKYLFSDKPKQNNPRLSLLYCSMTHLILLNGLVRGYRETPFPTLYSSAAGC
jgi:hypothetical protein